MGGFELLALLPSQAVNPGSKWDRTEWLGGIWESHPGMGLMGLMGWDGDGMGLCPGIKKLGWDCAMNWTLLHKISVFLLEIKSLKWFPAKDPP